mgnify:CR=1 FL=1
MALETGGLDAQVEQRMDAYRGNPQQLQQRYGANKELLDLLALQKLTSEKQAAARDMQMQQQQQPGTIAQQREQEALELTKQQMGGTLGQLAQNTKGTLDQKQSLQNKNMNKMAQNASKPQLGAGAGLAGLMGGGAKPPVGNPQTAGIAGARMAQAQQRPPVRRMAQGGIVSFAGADGNNEVVGGKRTLTEAQKQAFRAKFGGSAERLIYQVEAGTVSSLTAGADKQAAIAEILGDPVATPPERRADPLGLANFSKPPSEDGPEGISSLLPNQAPPSVRDAVVPPPRQSPLSAETTSVPYDPMAGSPEVAPEVIAQAVVPEAAAPDVTNQATAPTPDGTNIPQVAMGGGDPMSALQQGLGIGDSYYDLEGKAATKDAQIAQMEALDRELYDPERERQDELTAFLIGTGGTGSIGGAMRGGYSASSAVANKNRAAERARLFDKFNIEDARDTNDITMRNNIMQLGRTMYSEAAADRRNAQTALASMRNQDVRAMMAQAKNSLQALQNDRQFKLDSKQKDINERVAAAQEMYNSGVITDRKLDGNRAAMAAIEALRADIAAEITPSTTIPKLQQELQMADDDEIPAIEAELKLQRELLAGQVYAIMNEGGLIDQEMVLEKQFYALTGVEQPRRISDVDSVTTR